MPPYKQGHATNFGPRVGELVSKVVSGHFTLLLAFPGQGRREFGRDQRIMRSFNLTLGQILTSPSQYVIPVFQRYYRWDQPQWDKLWADLAGLQQPGKTGRHFLGFLVLIPESVVPGQISKYHLIDGQQRLMTLSLLLCALRDASRVAGFEELAQEIALTTLEHQFRKGTDRYRVFPKLRDRDQYIACLGGEPPAEGRLGSAMRYFSGRLATIPGAGTDDGLRAFFGLLTQRLEFVYAQLEGENPFNIFKSLNSTGVPLGQADLIRNFVFMHVPVEEQDEFEQSLWKPTERQFQDAQGNIDELAFSSLFRDYLMRNGGYVPLSDTFECFQRHYGATDFDPRRVAGELKLASEWYEILRGRRPDPSTPVEGALHTLRQLDSSTTFSLMLNLYERRQRGELSAEGTAEAILLLAGFILRRLVCGENSRAYARMFVQAIAMLGDDPVESLRRFLEARNFPDTPSFVGAFARLNLYGSRYRKVVLEALERATGHKEPVLLTNAQIEHIMPQTLTDEWRLALGPDAERIHGTWLHTPGNLTLTGYNAELQNKPFEEKRKEYRDSNIVMTRRLADMENWGEAQIRERGEAMARVAAEIWPGPAAAVRPIDQETKTSVSRFDLRLRYWTRFREHLAAAGSSLAVKEPRPNYSLRCGRLAPRITLFAYLNLRNERIAVGALFDGESQRQVFRALHENRDAIEAEVGAKLVWTHGTGLGACEILLRNPVNPANEPLWPTYFDWMRRALETFERVLGHRAVNSQPAKAQNSMGSPSSTGALYVEYWSAQRDRLIQHQSVMTPRKPLPQHWTNFTIGRAGFHLAAVASVWKKEIGVDLILSPPLAKPHFHLLAKDRAAIEGEFGTSLEWRELPAGKESHVVLRRSDCDPSQRENWPEQHAWLQSNLEAFHKVFGRRIKELILEHDTPQPAPP